MKSLRLIRQNQDFAWLLLADIINSIGVTFSSVLIYYSLDKFNINTDHKSWWFTFAYLALIIPSYFGAKFAEKFGRNFHLASAIIGANIFCLISLFFTIYAFLQQHILLMLLSEVAVSFTMGFIAPFQIFYHQQRFTNNDLAQIAIIDTIKFGIESVLGFALATWLLSIFNPILLFSLDGLSYLLSSIIIIMLLKKNVPTINITPTFSKIAPIVKMNPQQRRLFWLTPMVAVMGMPIMSLGPVLTSQVSTSEIAISGVLIFLLARTIGQFIGPVLASIIDFKRLLYFKGLLPMCAFIFFSCYYLLCQVTNLAVMIVLVIIAHLFSNIAGMTAYYALLSEFDNIESVSAKQGQYVTLLGFGSALFATGIQTQFGLFWLFVYLGFIWLGICVLSLQSDQNK